MTCPIYHIEQIEKLNRESKRLNLQLKVLRTQKKVHEKHIYIYMKRNSLETYKGFKLSKLEPKPQRKRIPKSQKQQAVMNLCRMTGIPDPQKFIEDLKAAERGTGDDERAGRSY